MIILSLFFLLMIWRSLGSFHVCEVVDNSTLPEDFIDINVKLIGRNFQKPVINFKMMQDCKIVESYCSLFCTSNQMDSKACESLLNRVKYEQLSTKAGNLAELDIIREDISKVIPNAHLMRLKTAVNAELRNKKKNFEQRDNNEQTNYLTNIATGMYNSMNNNSFRPNSRMAVIHSCSLEESDFRILTEILCTMKFANLLDELDFIWVLNYGKLIPHDEITRFRHKVNLIQVSQEIDMFEVPTMIIIHTLCQLLNRENQQTKTVESFAPSSSSSSDASSSDVQLLYMHTKGVSYSHPEIVVEEWRNMMMYFLVEQHESVKHLLLSGEFDVVGCQYSPHWRTFSGNFWWASARYIASELQQMSLSSSSKYDAEMWQLSGARGARTYLMHSNDINLSYAALSRYYYCQPHLDPDCHWAVECPGPDNTTYLAASAVDCKCQRIFDEDVLHGKMDLIKNAEAALLLDYDQSTHCRGHVLQSSPPHLRH